jgi:hypothetical protein
MRLTCLLEQAIFREFHWIAPLLHRTDFASTNGDLYTNKERLETYGCLVLNMLLQQYVIKVSFICCFVLFGCVHLTLSLLLSSSGAGRSTSVCQQLYNEGAKNLVVLEVSEKTDLETVIVFEKVSDSKTGMNIADWLLSSHLKSGLKGEYILCHATDGASNAVASSMEFQAMTHALKASSIRHYTCYAHQVIILPSLHQVQVTLSIKQTQN